MLHLIALVTLDDRYREMPETILLQHCPSSTLLQGPNTLQTVMLVGPGHAMLFSKAA